MGVALDALQQPVQCRFLNGISRCEPIRRHPETRRPGTVQLRRCERYEHLAAGDQVGAGGPEQFFVRTDFLLPGRNQPRKRVHGPPGRPQGAHRGHYGFDGGFAGNSALQRLHDGGNLRLRIRQPFALCNHDGSRIRRIGAPDRDSGPVQSRVPGDAGYAETGKQRPYTVEGLFRAQHTIGIFIAQVGPTPMPGPVTRRNGPKTPCRRRTQPLRGRHS